MLHDAIIVGAGPAGVSCALWLKQLGFKPLLVEKNESCGGLQLCNPYTNTWIATSAGAYGADVARALHANVRAHNVSTLLGVTAQTAKAVDGAFSVQLSCGLQVQGKTVVLAGGVSPKSGGMKARAGLLIGPGPVSRTRASRSRRSVSFRRLFLV